MGRKGWFPSFSSETQAPGSSGKVKVSASRSADTSSSNSEELSNAVEGVPACRLVALPREGPYPHHAVGIDDQVNSVIQLLEWENETEVAVAVILHGLGGMGKTTLADAVVARLDVQGWNCYTVVPLESIGSNMTICEDGQGEIQDKQTFIYIDNGMVRGGHILKLLPNSSCKKKLRLLVTARDEMVADVLSHSGRIHTHVYPVKPLLSQQDAMEVLYKKMGVPITMQIPDHHMTQINEILKICDGVPLVLKRIGEYICQSQDKDEAYRRVIEWSKDGRPFSSAEEYSIDKNGLLFDLDELPASAKEAFLDICYFFNGWAWDEVSCIMGEDELNGLVKRALLLKKEDCKNKVMVRHIISTIGRNISKGKRFTSAYELSKALQGNDLDIGGIKGIWLKDNISEPLFILAKKLDLMHDSLRVLALGDMAIVVGLDGQYCTQKFKQVVYFQAGLIPYIPFHATTSQELRILDCRLPDDNNGLRLTKISSELKVLNLNGVRYEHQFESKGVFGRLWSLRRLKLVDFKKLESLPEELSLLTQLEELDVSGCRMLAQLPKGLGELSVLSKLNLRSCGSLQGLPVSFGKLRSLKYLDLHSCTTLKQLPQNFGLLSSLEELDLGSCFSLRDLPSSFDKLSSLKALNLFQCTSLNRLPDNMNSLLVSVSMAQCGSLRDLPEDACSYLKFVKDLSLNSCDLLTKIPKNLVELASLRTLDLSFCGGLENLPEGFGQLKSLAELDLSSCQSLQQLSSDFHCLASLQILNMEWCKNLEGKWMDSVGQIKTLDFVSILGSKMLVRRWAQMEKENGEESWHFAVRTRILANYKQCSDGPGGRTYTTQIRQKNEDWKNVENMLSKVASKLFTGRCLLTDSQGEPFSLSTVAPSTVLLVMYPNYKENHKYSWSRPWKLLEEVVKHTHPLPCQMIYVGKYFGNLSKGFADRIMAYATEESDAGSLFNRVLEVTACDISSQSRFLVAKVVAEEGRKNFSTWKDITDSCVDILLSKSTLYSHLQKLIETPPESNVKLLRALFDTEESKTSSMFLRNYTEPMGVDGLRGKTVLLFVSVMHQHPFHFLTEIYSKAKTNDDMEILSIPIPVEVQARYGEDLMGEDLMGENLAAFDSILKNVPWPVLRNPWLLRQEVYYFFERKCSELNPAILVVVEPNGRIRNKNAMPLVEMWGTEVYPFTEEKMRQLEQLDQQPLEEKLSEYILNAILQR